MPTLRIASDLIKTVYVLRQHDLVIGVFETYEAAKYASEIDNRGLLPDEIRITSFPVWKKWTSGATPTIDT